MWQINAEVLTFFHIFAVDYSLKGVGTSFATFVDVWIVQRFSITNSN